MIEIPSMRPETRYGVPMADLLLFNREYIVGYSILLRQPRWAMEVIDPDNSPAEVERVDNFRADLRVPEQWRVDLKDYVASGFDRGHLISSADRRAKSISNSETFLMSNMAPQRPGFNRGIWGQLEAAVRELAAKDEYLEVYAICGPLFNFNEPVEKIGDGLPVPHGFFKSVLAETRGGRLKMWTFAISNDEKPKKELKQTLRPAADVERWSGVPLWDKLRGEKADRLRAAKGRMWARS